MKFFAIFLAAFATQAFAQFKCTDAKGSVTLQQVPCPMSSASAAMPRGLGLQTPEQRAARTQANAGMSKLKIGMSEQQVAALMGPADRRNKTVTAGGVREQFTYRLTTRTVHLYVEGGLLVAMQDDEK